MSQNGLRNSERANDQDEDDVHEKKTTQLFFGIEQRISHKQQGNIVEKELQTQNAKYQARRRWIKGLHYSEPDKKKKRHEERRPEQSDSFSPVSQEKGEINDSDQNVQIGRASCREREKR